MTFEEAKNRRDYRFIINASGEVNVKTVVEAMKNRKTFCDYDDLCSALFVMEVGHVDVEMNINLSDGKIVGADLFCCVKYGKGSGDWESDQYIDGIEDIDWHAKNILSEIERKMFDALDDYVTRRGYSYDHPNCACEFIEF